MSETSVFEILGVVITALWGVTLALIGVVWSQLRERIAAHEHKVHELDAQNTAQETAIGRLTERMIAREEAHAQHREDVTGRLDRLEGKIDQLLRGSSRGSPYPGSYSVASEVKR